MNSVETPEFRIDQDFIAQCAVDARCEPILREYLVGLFNNPCEKYRHDYHVHYATRLQRALANEVVIDAN